MALNSWSRSHGFDSWLWQEISTPPILCRSVLLLHTVPVMSVVVTAEYFSGTGWPGLSWTKAVKWVCYSYADLVLTVQYWNDDLVVSWSGTASVAVLTYKALHRGSPRYLSSLVHVTDVSGRPALRSAGLNRLWIPPFKLSTIRRSSVSGCSRTILEQAARQCHVSHFVVGFRVATETHTVPAVIPRHYHVTFLNCNTHSGPSSGIAT